MIHYWTGIDWAGGGGGGGTPAWDFTTSVHFHLSPLMCSTRREGGREGGRGGKGGLLKMVKTHVVGLAAARL